MAIQSALQRAAILIKSLPKKQAKQLLSRLDAEQLQTVLSPMRNDFESDEELVRLAAEKFIEQFTLLQNANSKRGDVSPVKSPLPFAFLEDVHPSQCFELLMHEHPLTIATILSYVTTDLAVGVLQKFEPSPRISILKRLCRLNETKLPNVNELSDLLKTKLEEKLNSRENMNSGMRQASRILSCADALERNQLIGLLEHNDPGIAADIEPMIFEFEGIVRLSADDIKTVLQRIDTSLWAPALKNSSRKLRRKILTCFADRPRQILNRELKSIGAVDYLVENQAKTKIVKACIRLAEQKLIRLPQSNRTNLRAA
ncbi:MAG: FliG C-terminal domain-containing protein [Planctomycetota bacterium]